MLLSFLFFIKYKMNGRIFVDDDDVGAQYFAFPEDETTNSIPSLNETIFEHISPNDLTTVRIYSAKRILMVLFNIKNIGNSFNFILILYILSLTLSHPIAHYHCVFAPCDCRVYIFGLHYLENTR